MIESVIITFSNILFQIKEKKMIRRKGEEEIIFFLICIYLDKGMYFVHFTSLKIFLIKLSFKIKSNFIFNLLTCFQFFSFLFMIIVSPFFLYVIVCSFSFCFKWNDERQRHKRERIKKLVSNEFFTKWIPLS